MRKKLIITTIAHLAILLGALTSGAQNPKDKQDGTKLADGFYLVRGQGSTTSDFEKRSDEDRLVVAPRSNDVPNKKPEVIYLVRRTADIPLELASDPKIVGNSPSERRLVVQIADKLKEQLFQFTRDHLGDQVVIVVNNEAVMHTKIRSPIDDGRFEISTCNSDLSRLAQFLRREPNDK
jgi:hypothetical protein